MCYFETITIRHVVKSPSKVCAGAKPIECTTPSKPSSVLPIQQKFVQFQHRQPHHMVEQSLSQIVLQIHLHVFSVFHLDM